MFADVIEITGGLAFRLERAGHMVEEPFAP